MAVTNKISAIKTSPKHLLGIQNLSILEAKSILNEAKTFTLKYKLKNPFTIGRTDAQFRWVYLDDKFDKRPGKLSFIQKFDDNIDTNTLYYSVEKPIRSKKYKSIIEEITRKTAEIIIKLDIKLYPLNKYIIVKLIRIEAIKILNNKFRL